MGIPGPMIVGPILTGAYFGDKLSPISESTNCAAAAAETDLMEHVHKGIPQIIMVITQVIEFKPPFPSIESTAATPVSSFKPLASAVQISFYHHHHAFVLSDGQFLRSLYFDKCGVRLCI